VLCMDNKCLWLFVMCHLVCTEPMRAIFDERQEIQLGYNKQIASPWLKVFN